MIIPGLEFRLGFGYENNDAYNDSIVVTTPGLQAYEVILVLRLLQCSCRPCSSVSESDDISQFNAWLSYQTRGLTLAAEWISGYLCHRYVELNVSCYYQFNDFFALTFRYSHEDFEADVPGGGEGDSNRFTIGPMFTITDYLTIGIEYSHAELDSINTGYQVDELMETIFLVKIYKRFLIKCPPHGGFSFGNLF